MKRFWLLLQSDLDFVNTYGKAKISTQNRPTRIFLLLIQKIETMYKVFFLCVVYLLLDNKGLRAGAPLAVVLVAFS